MDGRVIIRYAIFVLKAATQQALGKITLQNGGSPCIFIFGTGQHARRPSGHEPAPRLAKKLNIYTRRAMLLRGRFHLPRRHGCGKIADLADCDVLCTCLPCPQHVMDTVLGSDGLYT